MEWWLRRPSIESPRAGTGGWIGYHGSLSVTIGYYRLLSVTIGYLSVTVGYRRLLWVTYRLPKSDCTVTEGGVNF